MPDIKGSIFSHNSRVSLTLSFDPQQLAQILAAIKSLSPLTPAQQADIDMADAKVKKADQTALKFDQPPPPKSK